MHAHMFTCLFYYAVMEASMRWMMINISARMNVCM
jgi:hypothetical protein